LCVGYNCVHTTIVRHTEGTSPGRETSRT
jgi:hypothetical protein